MRDGTERPAITVVIPAFDEAERIGATVESVRTHLRSRQVEYQLVVVADGTDGTRDIAERLASGDCRTSVLGSAERRGKGRAVREGVEVASGAIVGFMDGDGKTPVDQLDAVLDAFARGADVVIGSRRLDGSVTVAQPPWWRRAGSLAFAAVVHRSIGLRSVPDTQCGFKFFRSDVAMELFGRQRIDGYMFDVEILHLASRSGFEIVQLPVVWRADRDTRSPVVTGTVRHAVDLLRIRWWASRSEAVSRTSGSAEGEEPGPGAGRPVVRSG